MFKNLSTKKKLRLAKITSFILEVIILYVLILAWVKAGGLELKETWLKYTSIFAIIFANDGLSSLFEDKIYSLFGVEKEKANWEKKLEELTIEAETVNKETDEEKKKKFYNKSMIIGTILFFMGIGFIGIMVWIFLLVAKSIN